MKILRHRLCKDDGEPFPFVSSPNFGGNVEPKYLVIHYTAGPDAAAAINWFASKRSGVSAHVVIDREGKITQMVSFDRIAYHAGESHWDGLSGLNRYSIGIELANAGRLSKCEDKWLAWFGKLYKQEEVIEAVHKNETSASGWHVYTSDQLASALELALVLKQKYNLLDIVGHDDISPGRKHDPGPAFPMQSFRSKVLGRAEDEAVQHETIEYLNIRSGPGAEFPKISEVPLPPGAPVEVIEFKGIWRLVDVLAEHNNIKDLQGWVHGRYLKRRG